MMRAFVLVVVASLFASPADAESFSLREAASTRASFDISAGDPSWSFQDEVATTTSDPVSPGRAVLYSLLLPGLGDWKLGNRSRATVFFAVEGAIWLSFAAFQYQGGDLEDDYQYLAMRFAGVTQDDHSDDFYATIRDYDSSEEYEAVIKDEGRFTPPYIDGSEALDAYFTENRVDDFEPWLWASTDRRLQYSETRSSSKTAYRRADYMLAAAATNRVVSAVFAYAAARSAAKHEVGLDLDVSPRGDVALTFSKKF